MAVTVEFYPYTMYHNTLSEVVEHLIDMSDQLFTDTINIAVSGKWQAWDAKQPDGAEFVFTEEMIRNTGDKNADILVELRDKIWDAKELLSRRINKKLGEFKQ
jgi:hypothetical protein